MSAEMELMRTSVSTAPWSWVSKYMHRPCTSGGSSGMVNTLPQVAIFRQENYRFVVLSNPLCIVLSGTTMVLTHFERRGTRKPKIQ